MKINVFVGNPSDGPWIGYVLDTWKRISRSPAIFEIVFSPASLSACPTILYEDPSRFFALTENIRAPFVAIPSARNRESGPYQIFRVPSVLEEDPRLQGETIPYFGKMAPSEAVERKALRPGFTLGFDLLFNIFAHLSCLEECEFERRNNAAPSPLSKKWKNRDWVHKPVVNYYFSILEQLFSLLGVEKKRAFPYATGFQVCLTHDIDALDRSFFHALKQQVFFLLRSGQQLRQLQLKKALNLACKAAQLFWKGYHGWHFETVLKEEKEYGYQSTFNFYAGNPKKMPLFLRLMDPSYNLLEDRRIRAVISQLEKNGCEIGLHGSYLSYGSSDILKNEKSALSTTTSQEILSSRQHWLQFAHEKTLQCQNEAGLKVDTTLGYNDRPGFRSGIVHPYFPYDHLGQKTGDVLEIPMILMDSHLIEGGMNGINFAWQSSEVILNEMKKFSGCCSVVWHTHTFDPLYGAHGTYQKLLKWIHENQGRGIGACEAFGLYGEHVH